MTEDTDLLVRCFIEGELAPEEEEEALCRIAASEEARALLRLDRQLKESFQPARRSRVPNGFAARTLALIQKETVEQPVSSVNRWAWLQRLWEVLTAPRSVTLRPAYGFIAVAVVALAGLFWMQGPAAETADRYAAATKSSQMVTTRFVYINNKASSVAVAGDFTEWEPRALKLRRVDGKQIWAATLPLPKGEHQYMFLIDGEKWVTDPLAPVQRKDGFGYRNAVITL